MNKVTFKVLTKDKKTKARTGKLVTPHGVVQTPSFNPVGTQASVKALDPKDLRDIGVQILLANTYHLHLRPGEKLVKKFGGVSKFMSWNGPTMTDSGGFQVFSLGIAQESMETKLGKFTEMVQQEKTGFMRQVLDKTQRIKPAKIDEEGVTFYSHLDGSRMRLTPKSSIKMQEALGADLIVAFDDHESPLWNHEETKQSLDRTNRWGIESVKAHKRADQLMYGVVHGGNFQDLREESARFTDKHFNAISIGGAYVSKQALYNMIDWTMPLVDEQKPRHLLGIGEIQDIFEGVVRGVDFFDCVAPTRRARHANLYTSPKNGGTAKQSFTFSLMQSRYANDPTPLDPGCKCFTCQNFSKAYVHHLFKAKEILAMRLATYHNVYFITDLMRQIRQAIEEGRLDELKKQWLKV